jgi:hypothetical protein
MDLYFENDSASKDLYVKTSALLELVFWKCQHFPKMFSGLWKVQHFMKISALQENLLYCPDLVVLSKSLHISVNISAYILAEFWQPDLVSNNRDKTKRCSL